MRNAGFAGPAVSALIVLLVIFMNMENSAAMDRSAERIIDLPEPAHEGPVSLEQTLLKRRSERYYSDAPLSLKEISQLLWAAQGITGGGELRTAPSAGALYPLELFVAAGEVKGLDAGIYRYHPVDHTLEREISGDSRRDLWAAALRQSAVREAPAVFVFTAVFERTTQKYSSRGRQYVFMEAGHAAQNLCLQAEALDLGAVTIGAFDDSGVKNALGLNKDTRPLYLLPAGKTD
ncbi:MAG: SagB/ThcOx family dehydrogenase [Desulfosalsimonas sp.]